MANFTQEIVNFFQSPQLHTVVMADRKLYTEFIPILIKMQGTFQARDMSKTGDVYLHGYLQQLSLFTLESYKSTNNASIKFHACRLNYLW